ncbi:hypothetical protein [Georgenia faecalis]|uniref:hypothetical protein n=1 Tax=Georgenia faecalis TaxID=2483799 RepID=UPI000FD791E9|nr:hypothetical protein [Georgenia faecalis]
MALTPTKLHYPTGSDSFQPHVDIEALARSAVTIVPVANATEAAALAAAYGPTPSKPLFVRRIDTGVIYENAGSGWFSINPQTYESDPPSGGTFTTSQLVVTCVIPVAPFARTVMATATIYGTNIAGAWDAALSDTSVSVWTGSPRFGRFPNPQGSVTISQRFALAAGQGTALRGWVGYRSGGNQTFTASADAKYSNIVATVSRAG